jgi:hypothetical protein
VATPPASVLAELLARHVPVLRYDSQEPYFCDSAAEWTDNPGNQLIHADGTVIARATPSAGEQQLALGFLGPRQYANGLPASGSDRIADPAHDYVAQARAMHGKPGYANRAYGHWATGSDGRLWLAYWFFYFYNDYNLLGPLLPAGLHEGDWEMIQLRLDEAAESPDLAVYAVHRHAAARDWNQVERVGSQPVVYPARGSHTSYFSAGPHWTGHWFDHANGKRPGPPLTLEVIEDGDPAYAWATWPGLWGGTVPKPGVGDDIGVDDDSPRGPGGHAQWRDPVKLVDTVKDLPAPTAADLATLVTAPTITVSRDGANLRIQYSTTAAGAVALIVAINSPQESLPPATYHVTIGAQRGTAEIPAGLHDGWSYDVHVSVATRDGRASEATEARLAPVT